MTTHKRVHASYTLVESCREIKRMMDRLQILNLGDDIGVRSHAIEALDEVLDDLYDTIQQRDLCD